MTIIEDDLENFDVDNFVIIQLTIYYSVFDKTSANKVSGTNSFINNTITNFQMTIR